jgi:hypothetical protein
MHVIDDEILIGSGEKAPPLWQWKTLYLAMQNYIFS